MSDGKIKIPLNHVGGKEGDEIRAAVRGEYFEFCSEDKKGANPFYLEKKIFPGLLDDVSKRELYEAVNIVQPSLIRTEADEFTYTFHIIIRYEIEKMAVNGKVSIEDLPRIWNDKYEEYLGIRPSCDREGVLQDVHWASGFGYFPTYAIGNMYNAMYYNRMKNELDIDALLRSGDFGTINGWMEKNVFAKANLLAPSDWITDITGRAFTPVDFLDYLEDKYSELYEL